MPKKGERCLVKKVSQLGDLTERKGSQNKRKNKEKIISKSSILIAKDCFWSINKGVSDQKKVKHQIDAWCDMVVSCKLVSAKASSTENPVNPAVDTDNSDNTIYQHSFDLIPPKDSQVKGHINGNSDSSVQKAKRHRKRVCAVSPVVKRKSRCAEHEHMYQKKRVDKWFVLSCRCYIVYFEIHIVAIKMKNIRIIEIGWVNARSWDFFTKKDPRHQDSGTGQRIRAAAQCLRKVDRDNYNCLTETREQMWRVKECRRDRSSAHLSAPPIASIGINSEGR